MPFSTIAGSAVGGVVGAHEAFRGGEPPRLDDQLPQLGRVHVDSCTSTQPYRPVYGAIEKVSGRRRSVRLGPQGRLDETVGDSGAPEANILLSTRRVGWPHSSTMTSSAAGQVQSPFNNLWGTRRGTPLALASSAFTAPTA